MNNSTGLSQRFTPKVEIPTLNPLQNKTSSNPEKMISETERNSRFKILKKKKLNKKCCDCNAKFPQWASASFGILICMNCSGKHRFLGPNISFVRSIAMDNWKEREIKAMEIGGNKRFKSFLEEEMVDGEVDYTSESIQRYKEDLLDEVMKMFGNESGEVKNQDKEDNIKTQKNENKNEKEVKPERKASLEIKKEDIEEIKEKKEEKPLEEQKTKVVMAESKITSGNSESTGGKRGRRRGKNNKFAGKRIKKVNLDQLVTDDLKIKKGKIKKKGLFSNNTITQKNDEKSEKKEASSKPNVKEQNSEKIKTQIKKTKFNKFSGFGSDNLSGETTSKSEIKVDSSSQMGFGVFGGYGSDDLNPPKRVKSTNASNGEQQGIYINIPFLFVFDIIKFIIF